MNRYFDHMQKIYGVFHTTVEKNDFIKSISFIRENNTFRFKQLIDIVCIDELQLIDEFGANKNIRFRLVYIFLNLRNGERLAINVFLKNEESIESIVKFFPNANWCEREIFDLFGIIFENHPHLKRILTDSIEGYPLRKDFPSAGFIESYYDKDSETIIQKSINSEQQFNSFDDDGFWIGLPGDEKASDFKNLNKSFSKLDIEEYAKKIRTKIEAKKIEKNGELKNLDIPKTNDELGLNKIQKDDELEHFNPFVRHHNHDKNSSKTDNGDDSK